MNSLIEAWNEEIQSLHVRTLVTKSSELRSLQLGLKPV